jgi:hypothetical protein
MYIRTLAGVALLAFSIVPVAAAQKKSQAADTVAARFTTGSTQMIAGYTRFEFADLDARLAAANLPHAAHGGASIGLSTDIRKGPLMFGVGFQQLITQDHSDAAYRTRMSGSYALLDVGVAMLNARGWAIYPVAGLGTSQLSVNVREKGSFTFDEGLSRPSRELGMSGLGALTHAGLLVERRLRRGESEFAISVRAGITRSLGSQAWSSDASTVQGGPSGVRATYARIAFSKPLRHRRDALVPTIGTVAQAIR